MSQKPSMLEEKQGQFWNLHRIPNKTSYPDFRFFLLFCCFLQVNSGLKIGVCQISFGSLPKPNIRQFGRAAEYSAEAEYSAVWPNILPKPNRGSLFAE